MTLEEFLASKTPEFREKVKKEHSQMVLQHAISRLRYEQNLTQEEVARKLQLSQSVVGKIPRLSENPDSVLYSITQTTKNRLAAAFCWNISLLINDRSVCAEQRFDLQWKDA